MGLSPSEKASVMRGLDRISDLEDRVAQLEDITDITRRNEVIAERKASKTAKLIKKAQTEKVEDRKKHVAGEIDRLVQEVKSYRTIAAKRLAAAEAEAASEEPNQVKVDALLNKAKESEGFANAAETALYSIAGPDFVLEDETDDEPEEV